MKEAQAILDEIHRAKRIVITSHRAPDGDSIGSSVAMYHFLIALGKNPVICHPDPSQSSLDWVKENVNIFDYENDSERVKQEMLGADLIFCLDYNGAMRMGEAMGTLLNSCTGKKIMIDHHPHPDDFVDIAVSNTTVGSTSELIYELIAASGNLELMNVSIGTPIYLGIMTDTGSFRFSSVSARTHEILSHLLAVGVEHTSIHENTFDNVHLDSLKLRGFAMSEKLKVVPGYRIAYISLTEDELSKFNYKKGDTDGLVNIALSVEGVRVAVFFSEKDGEIKISFRSKDRIPVNSIASEQFSGGGHLNAAGGFSTMSIEETINKFIELVPKYFNDLREV